MSVIFHLSDTHFGTEQQDVITALLRLVREETPDIVIHSGDITQRARRSQFRAAAEFMELLEVRQRVVLPGNHDIPLYNVAARIFTPYGNHLRAFGAELEPELESPDALIIGVNTTSPLRHKDGKVSEYQITRVSRRLCSAKEEQLRIVVTHQPVLVIRPRDEANLLHGHREAVYAWANAGADLILGGHIHLPYVRSLREQFVDLPRTVWAVQAGTAVSWRVRGNIPNSVNVIRYTPSNGLRHCSIERWDHNKSAECFSLVERKELSLDDP